MSLSRRPLDEVDEYTGDTMTVEARVFYDNIRPRTGHAHLPTILRLESELGIVDHHAPHHDCGPCQQLHHPDCREEWRP